MNNSFLATESVTLELEEIPKVDLVRLREQETELLKIIQAIEDVAKSEAWGVLKEKVFDGVVTTLKKRRDYEVEKKPLNGPLIHSINGQLEWAKRYSDFSSLANIYKQELTKVRSKLNESSRTAGI